MKVAIIGLGWFGTALARELQAQHTIIGTTRSEAKAQTLRQQGLKVELLDYPDLPREGLLDQDVIVLNIPPRPEHLEWFRRWPWQKARLIFIGSTSVYGEAQGVVDETVSPRPDTASGKILLEQEEYFSHFSQVSIVRFGGLFGAGRHPGKFLSGRQDLEGGQRPVNLVHQKDTVFFAKKLIEERLSGIFNLVHPDHPTREEYYQSYCRRRGLALPEFRNDPVSFKLVRSSRVLSFYTFQAGLEED